MYLVRRQILDQIVEDLTLVKSDSGYNHTIPSTNIFKGIKLQSTIKNFPCVQVQVGSEVSDELNESGDIIHRKTEVLIAVTINTTDIDEVEKYIEDIKVLFSANIQDVIATNNIFAVKYVDGYVLKEIVPFVENTKNLTTIYFILEVSYTDVVDGSTITVVAAEDEEYIITEDS